MANCCPEKNKRTFAEKHVYCLGCNRLLGEEPGKAPLHEEVGHLHLCEECGDTAKEKALQNEHQWPKETVAFKCTRCFDYNEGGSWHYDIHLDPSETKKIERNNIVLPIYACPQCEYKTN